MAESNRVELDYTGIAEVFPEADPGLKPFGSRIIVQIRKAQSTTKGGIIIPDESQGTEFWNTQVAKVVALGPGAFKNRDNLTDWPEGDWCREGAYVRVPKYGGDRWFVDLPGAKSAQNKVCFVIFNDLDLIGEITCDPMDVVAFL